MNNLNVTYIFNMLHSVFTCTDKNIEKHNHNYAFSYFLFAYAWALLGLGLSVCTDDFAGACRPEHNQGDKV